jgi:hypothetical protein
MQGETKHAGNIILLRFGGLRILFALAGIPRPKCLLFQRSPNKLPGQAIKHDDLAAMFLIRFTEPDIKTTFVFSPPEGPPIRLGF